MQAKGAVGLAGCRMELAIHAAISVGAGHPGSILALESPGGLPLPPAPGLPFPEAWDGTGD